LSGIGLALGRTILHTGRAPGVSVVIALDACNAAPQQQG
jgi:hypothetical protein